MLCDRARTRSESVLIASSCEVGVRMPRGWGGGLWTSVKCLTWRRPEATCWTAKKVNTPASVRLGGGRRVGMYRTEAEPEVVVGYVWSH